MPSHASHDKSVDSPQTHRGLKAMPVEKRSMQTSFKIGERVAPVEPSWESSQRHGCRRHDAEGLLTYNTGEDRPGSSHRQRKAFDHTDNADWTADTKGNTLQKVLQEAGHEAKLSRGEGWAASSCAKTLEKSPKRLSIEREPKVIPNEKPRRDPHAFVSGWNTESMKTVEPEPKRELDLAPKPSPKPEPKPLARPEDWESNLKTLPNCARSGERKPNVYADIKESVVPQTRSVRRSF